MSWNVNNIIRMTVTFRDTRYENNIKNVLNFRGFTGELGSDVERDAVEEFAGSYLTRLLGQLPTTTYLRSVKSINMSRPTDPAVLVEYEPGDNPGGLSPLGTFDVPQASACIVRQAYSRGRKSIGRVFIGPLDVRFIDKGEVVKDPLGVGDLQEVLDCLGDPFTYQSFTMRPIVCGAKTTTGTPQMDVFSQRFSRLVTFHRTRRLNVGE